MPDSKEYETQRTSQRGKLRSFKTLAVPMLLDGCETWKMNVGDDKTNRCASQQMSQEDSQNKLAR